MQFESDTGLILSARITYCSGCYNLVVVMLLVVHIYIYNIVILYCYNSGSNSTERAIANVQ